MKTKREATQALIFLRRFIGPAQLQCLGDACRGEEKQYFFDLLCEYAGRIVVMPKTYQTDGQGDEALVHLHYFTSSCDWWIREKDQEAEQLQAFGWASLNGYEPELGYISIEELLENGAELDLHWTPKPFSKIKAKPEAPLAFEFHCLPAPVRDPRPWRRIQL